ncbi:hypothetical protein [Aliikangiella coralliicola]|uniref:NolW-like domain-containing protein n=1 Tax=Aliikangiella coralliicola TaxID=2592383 RepID=A0A545UJE3_9GAMM|nr:hypothetical protein [Aliikangiella coralliicola]TQV89586.1 hypothetical protein FLL46_01500 [Aliikangiella coralliicola]
MKLIYQITLTLILATSTSTVIAGSQNTSENNYIIARQDKTIKLTKLLDAVSKQSKKKFLIDSEVGVNVVAYGIDTDDITYNELLHLLGRNQMTAVDLDNYVNIIPARKAKRFAQVLPSATGQKIENDSQWVTKIVDCGNLDVKQLIPALRTLIDVNGHMAFYEPSNSLILVAPNATVVRVENIMMELNKNNPKRKS